MKKTSRRSFGKQITGALAALPIASLAATQDAGAQTRDQAKRDDLAKLVETLEIRTSHDTPPTVLIMDGSFIIETDKSDFDEKDEVAAQPKKYRRTPQDPRKRLFMAHVKIVDGSGEVLYRGNYHNPASNLSIAITTAENDVVTLGRAGNKFEVTTASNKKLQKTSGDDQPVGTKRLGRFRCRREVAGNPQASITSVAVRKDGTSVFDVSLADLPDNGRELKVMAWLAEA